MRITSVNNYNGDDFFNKKHTQSTKGIKNSLNIDFTKFPKLEVQDLKKLQKELKTKEAILKNFKKVKTGDESPYEKGRPEIISISSSQGITKKNNSYQITKDKNGNTICRIDYNNNNPKAAPFDEEEVRTPDGKLKSFTERTYSDDGTSWYKKSEYDKNGNLVKITETTCDASGKIIKSKNLDIENEPEISAHVSIGVPIEEAGDSELQKLVSQSGFTLIGRK